MKRIFLSLLLFCLPLAAKADGVVIPAVAYPAKVTIPDQRALICWSNGTERLAIETQFVGEGTNFAWVLPLPARPDIEEATSGLFTTLEYIFRPAIINNVTPWYLFLLACTGVVYLLATVRRNTTPRISDTLVSFFVALTILPLSACAGVPLLLLLPYVVWRVRSGTESIWSILAVLFLVFLMSSMLLPASLGTASLGVSGSEVSILSHETIGAYDTTTITAKNPQALGEWLQNNGYAVPLSANKIISNYVSRGWVFVATKLRRDSAGRVINSPQPLCFTFQTDKAVYPMQLTGIGSTNLTVELFVFGPLRAEARFFHTDRCGVPLFPQEEQFFSRGSTEHLRIVHPLLRRWVAESPVATKLSANLTPEMMAEDIELQWAPFAEIRHDLYSYEGACYSGLNYGVSVFVICLLLSSTVVAIKRDWHPRLMLAAGLSAIAGVLVATLFFAAVPKISVRLARFPAPRSQINLSWLGKFFVSDIETNHATSLAESRATLKKIQTANPELTKQNFLLGGSIREEDSPGNYILRQGTNGIEFIYFDADGGEHLLEK